MYNLYVTLSLKRYLSLRYTTTDGGSPFSRWLGALDGRTATRIAAYANRMKAGNWGNSRFVGEASLGAQDRFGARLPRLLLARRIDLGHPALRRR